MKANLLARKIPVLFFTTMDLDVDEEFGLEQGAVDYIHKPIKSLLKWLEIEYAFMIPIAEPTQNTATHSIPRLLAG